MAEPEPPRTPDTRAAGTASWVAVPPLDAPAVAGTAPYPVDHTASFAPAPPDAATVSFGGDATRPNSAPELPQIPGFQMLSVLGDGGMGTVFKALHLRMNKVVALKLIKSGWARDRDFHTRFALEVETLARLDHPNVVPIFDASSWSGLPYLTMKFVAGKTLYHHLERMRRDPPAAARLLAKVARAVHYLHQKGVVHRDLKPLNILLDTGDEPMVADFGLVKLADDDQGHSISLVPLGTRQYMSPEQTMGGRENYTPACDIWALGVILYELLAGYRPFSHEDTAELYRQIRFDPTPPLPARANAPAGLEAIARKCLAKSVGDRYATADAVAADLEKWAAGEAIPMPRERTPRRRMRAALASVALVALLGFSGIPAQPPRAAEVPAQRSIADRLRDGETVVLIGEREMPIVATRVLPGCSGAFADRKGYASLTSAGVTCIELSSDPLPGPVRFRATYAITVTQDEMAQAGIFVGGKEWPLAPRPWQTVVTFGHRAAPLPEYFGAKLAKETFGFALHRWSDTPPGTRHRFPTASRIGPRAADTSQLEWRTVEIVIAPDVVSGMFEGTPAVSIAGSAGPGFPPARRIETDLLALAKSAPRGTVPAFAAPYLGGSLGVYVFNAEAVFRELTLEPVR
jgi:hypothetical protein